MLGAPTMTRRSEDPDVDFAQRQVPLVFSAEDWCGSPGGRRIRRDAVRLGSNIDTQSQEFRANAVAMRALADELVTRRTDAAQGGPARARERHVARGKLLP